MFETQQAFPVVLGGHHHRGMTLRDWFAGQVLPVIAGSHRGVMEVHDLEAIALTAYALADAMLAQRLSEKKS